MTEPCDLTATEARRLIGRKKLSPVELMQSCINRIGKVNGKVNAVVAMDLERALAEAGMAEDAVMSGRALGALAGLPIGVKDLDNTEGLRTTQGSLLFRDFVPLTDDPMVANIRKAGGIVLFEDEAARQAYIEGPLAEAATDPTVSDIQFKRFDVLAEHSAITRGPVGVSVSVSV